ncbi:M23 family metallopeptidase [candidate division KSB1 bacterium]|nr:M23 family metallopeptidase [candidate division KSB1 bacterium]
MFTQKSRKQNLSILLIPDDHADPLSYKISFRMLRFLSIIGILLVIHIITGFIFYYEYANVNRRNRLLNKENVELKQDNEKVYKMYRVVEEFIKYQERVKSALGVNSNFEVSDRSKDTLEDFSFAVEQVSSQTTWESENKTVRGKLDFLTQTQSKYHDFAKSVPTLLPVEGVLTTDFQASGWFFPYRHLGIDIAAKKGTPVKASASGIVLFSNWTEELGKLIIIDHLNGFVTYYGHNQVLLKSERNFVEKGDVIALLGSSGKSTAPHLHFEIRKNGLPVDPKEYLLSFQGLK